MILAAIVVDNPGQMTRTSMQTKKKPDGVGGASGFLVTRAVGRGFPGYFTTDLKAK